MDKLQLLPVKENHISEVFNSTSGYNLTDIIRQDGDNPLLDGLTMLRDDVLNTTATFLNYIRNNRVSFNSAGQGSIRVKPSEARGYANEVFKSDKFKRDINSYRVGSYTNANISIWNNYIRKLLGISDELIVVGDRMMGYKTIVDDFNNIVIMNSNDYEVLAVSTRVGDDGFKLFEVEILDYDTRRSTNVYIVDHTDKSFKKYYNKLITLHRNAVYGDVMNKGMLWKTYFSYKERFMTMVDFTLSYEGKARAKIQREIDYAYAVSIHKLQGSTIDTIILDAMDICYFNSNRATPRTRGNALDMRNRLLYTGLSRASERGVIIYE